MYGIILIQGWMAPYISSPGLRVALTRWLSGSTNPRLGFLHRAGQYRSGGPPFSSPFVGVADVWNNYDPGRGPYYIRNILPGWRWLIHVGCMAGTTPSVSTFNTNCRKLSALWHGFRRWAELESANRMRGS